MVESYTTLPLRVNENFESRFKELEFILQNYWLIESLASSKVYPDTPAQIVRETLKQIVGNSSKWPPIGSLVEIHTSLLNGGIKNSCEISLLSNRDNNKIVNLRESLTRARVNFALMAVLLCRDTDPRRYGDCLTDLPNFFRELHSFSFDENVGTALVFESSTKTVNQVFLKSYDMFVSETRASVS